MSENPYDPSFLLVEAWQPRMEEGTLLALLDSTARRLGSLFPRVYYNEDRRGRPGAVPFTLRMLPSLLYNWNASRLDQLDLFFDGDASKNLSGISFSDMGGVYVTHGYNVSLQERVCLADPAWVDHLDSSARDMIELSSPITVTLSAAFDRLNYRDGVVPDEFVLPAPDYTRLYWRNYWSPLMLQWLGGEGRVFAQPWHSASRLPGGWLKLDTAPSPFEWNKPEHLVVRDEITANLRLPEVNERINAAMDEHGNKTWPNFVKAPV